MAISLTRYIDIVSGVGAGAAVGQRRLVGRFFADNELIPTDSYVEFDTADEVADYFGSSSEEYARAVFWFGWVSKNVTNAQSIQFARWASDDVPPQIFGAPGGQSLASWTSISSGAFSLTLGDITESLTAMDFSAAASLAAVAAIIQAKIRTKGFEAYFTGAISTTTLTVSAVAGGVIEVGQVIAGSGVTPGTTITALGSGTGGTGTYTVDTSQTAGSTAMTGGVQDPNYEQATVEYDATRGSFNLTGGADGTAEVAVTAGAGGSDIAGQLGWLSALAIFSNGLDEQEITDLLSESAGADNNFGSFAFLATLTEDQIVEAAEWNDTQNNMFMYSIPCTADNASALSAALDDLSGATLTLSLTSGEYPEQAPMMILAATNYDNRNATQNYMFQIFALTASVTTDSAADTYDALGVNYYGQTQTAGQLLEFYQRGVMAGLPSDFLDQNTYANEIWLKDAAAASIMTLLLALSKVSANTTGRAQLLTIILGVISQAIINGTISVGKALSATQKLFVTNETGDASAWQQVQNLGYWFDVQIVPYVEDTVTKYKAVYTLIYSKDDVIRKVEGRDIAI